MNFKNILNHPKTSAAGLLIAVASVAGVLSQQGVSLGKVGTGTVVSLASALATALLGLLAKDPETATSQPRARQQGQHGEAGRMDVYCASHPAAVDAGLHGCRRCAKYCQLDTGSAKRCGHGRFDRCAAWRRPTRPSSLRQRWGLMRPAICWWRRPGRTWPIPRVARWRSCKTRS